MSAAVPTDDALDVEERARANMYALVGRLFFAAPDPNLFVQICAAGEGGDEQREADALAIPWQAFRNACQSAYPALVKEEYDTLFISAGKARITLYTSHYLTGSAPDRHLMTLREELDRLGLARAPAAFDMEDHLAGVCDVMRFLIEDRLPLTEQRRFFERYLWPGAVAICDAVMADDGAGYYQHVGAFTKAFLEVEKTAFEMEESAA